MRAIGISLRLLLSAAATIALVACGSDDGPKRHRWYPNGAPTRDEDWHSSVSMLLKYDANHDGTITRAELEAGLKAEFNLADKNHTGCLDPDEVRIINEQRTKSDAAAASPLIDWKDNGCIDFDEYATTARSLFEQLDKDGDGELTPDELNPKKRGQPGPNDGPNQSEGRGGAGYP
jgi:Ca2+-binding EF-hand superfamily protein